MGEMLSPFALSPPPPSPPHKSANMPMLYYGLVVVGTAAIVLAVYNLLIIRWCARRHMQAQAARRANGIVEAIAVGRSSESSNRNLLASFKYKKTVEQEGEIDYDYECPVCLSVFEEGEEVKKLPRCKHCYHVLCIDMWLYSHSDCPVCRTPVGPLCSRLLVMNNNQIGYTAAPEENSREGLLESGHSSV